MKPFTLLTSLVALASWLPAETFYSPNKTVSADFFVDAEERLSFSVFRGEKVVIEPSALGITVDGVDLGKGVQLGEARESSFSGRYPMLGGKAEAENNYQGISIPVIHPSGLTYLLEARLFDEGIGYRYLVPGEGSRTVQGETSSFTVPANTPIWHFERKNGWKLKSYAGWWMKTPIEEMPTVSKTPTQGFPLVLAEPTGGYTVLTEAAVFNYSGMRAKAIGNRTFQADFTEGKKGFELEGLITTPWRTVITVDTLDQLVNQTVVQNLAPAPDPELFEDLSWIQPGWTAWRWQLQGVGLPKDQVNFARYAKELSWPFSLIDDGWEIYWDQPWEHLKEIVAQAEKSGIKIFVWKRWGDLRNPANNYQDLREWLDKIKEIGVVGVKVDFFDAEDLATRRGEEAVLRESAKRQLMINFHGCPKATGETRTYPNEVTREGIRGIELNFIRREGLLTPEHNAALPFTRLAVGHGDYTPLTFQPGHIGDVTIAHQLATCILYTSPMQIMNAIPTNLIHYPIKEVTDLMKSMPTVWDETRVLPGSEIGELAVMARRSGDSWYVGALNGGDAKEYDLDLNFLGEGTYEALLLHDHEVSNLVVTPQTFTTKATEKRIISLAAGGGFTLRLRKAGPGKE